MTGQGDERRGHGGDTDTLGGTWGPLSDLPGHPMMWILIISEILVFGGAFIAFAGARISAPALFAQSQGSLDRLAGAINTMVLLTSGLAAALAVHARAQGCIASARRRLAGAAALGVVFLAVKVVEYGHKHAAGIGFNTNTFFTLYYLTTGFHALHVVAGILILAIVAARPSLDNIETGAAFWHMVDLVWVLLFPVIYLMR
ncbi:MAG: cytochrome c oxidase subunit 3 [Pseudomonadota bacterium]